MARLYLTLYGVLFVTIGLFYASLTWVPELVLYNTSQRYYEQYMLGAYGLIEARLEKTPPAQWDSVVKELEPQFYHGLALYRLDKLDLGETELERLREGQLVFVEKNDQVRFYKRVANSDRSLMIVLGADQEQQRLDEAHGIAYIIESRFLSGKRSEWDSILSELRETFGMPLALLNIDDPQLPDDKLVDIKEGKLVVLDLEGHAETYYMRLGDTDQVFRAGPFELPLLLRYFNHILLMVLALLVALAVYVWVRPVWGDLKRIDRSVRQFGTGDLDSRLEVRKRSPLKPLADTFNAMAERMQRLIQSHRELTGAVSHELRTPIARLRFRVDMLEEPLSEGDRQRHLGAMLKDIQELEELVSESLSYSRLDRERPDLLLEPVALKDWLESLLIELEEVLPTEQVACELSPDSVNTTVELDYRLMGRAVKNLLRNARRHAASKVVLSGECGDAEARIVVEDDGSGVPEQERERIFEPFARLDSARDRESGGVGLGLAIVNQIARWHHGRVWVETSSLGGARFVIAWPDAERE